MSKEKRTRKLTVRFTPTEYKRLEDKFKNTTSSGLSHYVRSIILGKPIVIKYRNESLDGFMEEVISLRQELNAIGNNFNQAIKKLHLLKQLPEFRSWLKTNETIHQKIFDTTNYIEQRISKLSGKWLQG